MEVCMKIVGINFLSLIIIFFFFGCSQNSFSVSSKTQKHILFSPEIQKQIAEELGGKEPAILIIGKNGKTIALTMDGEEFEECISPEDAKKYDSINDNTPKICQGLQSGAKEMRESFQKLIIRNYKINPYCKIVEDVTGVRKEICKPYEW